MKKDCPIYTLDLETDPFLHGRLPEPFAADIFDGENHFTFWKSKNSNLDLIGAVLEKLSELPPGLVYIHNGGKFDLFYFLLHIEEKGLFVIHNRIVSCNMAGHTIRDSYSLMPFPLSQYQKDSIEYELFEKGTRDNHKESIIHYLHGDTRYLWELCSSFVKRFGARLTVGGTALRELSALHLVQSINEREDSLIRSDFYYGGRVQCFEKGIIESSVGLRCYDVNSMYPHVMRDFKHPAGKPTLLGKRITRNTCFLTVTGKNYGAFPFRVKNGTTYEKEYGTFNVSIHEWRAAEALRLFVTEKINRTIDFERRISFKTFVDKFYNERIQAKAHGDACTTLFCKYILNSAYGKFAFNVANAYEFQIRPLDNIMGAGWKPAFTWEGKFCIWKKHAWCSDDPMKEEAQKDRMRLNVATAASITGGARSVLLRAIASAERPIYCDTDSIICEGVSADLPLSDSALGAWKLEKTGNRIAVAGKKLYAMFDGDECIKQASKGVKLDPSEIVRVAQGETIQYHHAVPSFKWDGTHSFISRKVRLT